MMESKKKFKWLAKTFEKILYNTLKLIKNSIGIMTCKNCKVSNAYDKILCVKL